MGSEISKNPSSLYDIIYKHEYTNEPNFVQEFIQTHIEECNEALDLPGDNQDEVMRWEELKKKYGKYTEVINKFVVVVHFASHYSSPYRYQKF